MQSILSHIDANAMKESNITNSNFGIFKNEHDVQTLIITKITNYILQNFINHYFKIHNNTYMKLFLPSRYKDDMYYIYITFNQARETKLQKSKSITDTMGSTSKLFNYTIDYYKKEQDDIYYDYLFLITMSSGNLIKFTCTHYKSGIILNSYISHDIHAKL